MINRDAEDAGDLEGELEARENGRVYLEIVDATPAEAARGMAMLKEMVG